MHALRSAFISFGKLIDTNSFYCLNRPNVLVKQNEELLTQYIIKSCRMINFLILTNQALQIYSLPFFRFKSATLSFFFVFRNYNCRTVYFVCVEAIKLKNIYTCNVKLLSFILLLLLCFKTVKITSKKCYNLLKQYAVIRKHPPPSRKSGGSSAKTDIKVTFQRTSKLKNLTENRK